MNPLVASTGYLLCFLAYLGIAAQALLVRRGQPLPYRRASVLACMVMVLWAGMVTAGFLGSGVPQAALNLAEVARSFAWLHLLAALYQPQSRSQGMVSRRLVSGRALLAGGGVTSLLAITAALPVAAPLAPVLISLTLTAMLGAAVVGLMLSEKVYFGSSPSEAWGLKFLILALATLFAFDFYFFAETLMLRRMTDEIIAARGLVSALVVPLLAVAFLRMKSWTRSSESPPNTSRAAVMHGMALLGCGVYLLTMAGIAFVVRESGGEWGGSLQITFLVAAFLAMFVALGSGRFISQARIYIQKSFFTYKYDYREEWRRFIGMMSAHHPLTLGERIIHAVANMMDSPAGALWVWQRADNAFVPDSTWNYHGAQPSEQGESPFVAFLRQTGWVIETDAPPEIAEGQVLALPQWIADHRDAWLVIPLIHRGEVLGILVIDRARAARKLDWEDRDLLKTAAAQAASYLAEEQAAEALRDAQQFEDFNRRFAFVVHDIKNVVGQMSLMVENGERFGDNPEFQKDMLNTVRNSTMRMRALLDQLAEKRRRPETPRALIDLTPVVASVAERWVKVSPAVTSRLPAGPVQARAHAENLIAVLDLLIDNALEALGPAGTVLVSLSSEPERVVLEVKDDGPGMDPAFVRTELFRPLRSTKSSGYGIGAYQTRYMIREMGGQLEVDTAPSAGTTMRIILPAAAGLPIETQATS